MDKILQSMSGSKNVTVTNDGATILQSIYVDNPAAKVLQDISKVQDDEVRTPLPARAAGALGQMISRSRGVSRGSPVFPPNKARSARTALDERADGN